MSGQTAFAFEGFDECAFLAADIGPGAAPKLDEAWPNHAGCLDRGNFPVKNFPCGRVLVAQIDPELFGIHGPGRDQCALQDAMGCAFEKPTILEGSRFTFIGVDDNRAGGHLQQ